jgi:hypothetical protein
LHVGANILKDILKDPPKEKGWEEGFGLKTLLEP